MRPVAGRWAFVPLGIGLPSRAPRVNRANWTGAVSTFNVTGTRADAAERSRLRADGLDPGQIRQDAGQELWGINLPVLP
jgi:hypothetical protein